MFNINLPMTGFEPRTSGIGTKPQPLPQVCNFKSYKRSQTSVVLQVILQTKRR